MKKVVLFFLLLCIPSYSLALDFRDTELSFYRDSINTLLNEGIITGYSNGKFGPDNTITRAELLKVLLRSKNINSENLDKDIECFKDIKRSMWYQPYVCEAVKLGVVKGFSDGTFKPNSPVTVIEALAMSLRLYGIAPENGSPWYTTYQNLAGANNILDTSSYNIHTLMTRGKAADMILRIREYSKNKNPLTNISKGCTNTNPLTSGTYQVIVGEKTRNYILSVPRSYSSTNPAKFIIAIHGRTNSNLMVQNYMGLENKSDFIVAYPAGLPNGNAYSWSNEENINFVDTILRDVTDKQCIDRDNIHIVAHSLGAWFASKLACTRGDIFRSMSIVGGGGYSSICNNTPTAALIYQNENDTLSPPSTARATESKMKSINLCGNEKETIQIGNISCEKWKDCSSGNPVIYCKGYSAYGGDPHSWPIGAGDTMTEWIRGL